MGNRAEWGKGAPCGGEVQAEIIEAMRVWAGEALLHRDVFQARKLTAVTLRVHYIPPSGILAFSREASLLSKIKSHLGSE
jgi:hypothetical protein